MLTYSVITYCLLFFFFAMLTANMKSLFGQNTQKKLPCFFSIMVEMQLK